MVSGSKVNNPSDSGRIVYAEGFDTSVILLNIVCTYVFVF